MYIGMGLEIGLAMADDLPVVRTEDGFQLPEQVAGVCLHFV